MSRKPSLFMERTKIHPKRTASEIMFLLGEHGARSVTVVHRGDSIEAISFSLDVGGALHPFKLPVRVEGVFRRIQSRRRTDWDRLTYKDRDQEDAERIAWRQALRWVQAQLAMVDIGMSTREEVFLPYIQQPDGRTLFEVLAAGNFKQLGPGQEA